MSESPMNAGELAPCPFCGGTDIRSIQVDEYDWDTYCWNCMAHAPSYQRSKMDYQSESEGNWNKRAHLSRPSAALPVCYQSQALRNLVIRWRGVSKNSPVQNAAMACLLHCANELDMALPAQDAVQANAEPVAWQYRQHGMLHLGNYDPVASGCPGITELTPLFTHPAAARSEQDGEQDAAHGDGTLTD